MIRRDLRDDCCSHCAASLEGVVDFERVDHIYGRGEFAGERGIAVVAFCPCGTVTVIPWSVNPRRAA